MTPTRSHTSPFLLRATTLRLTAAALTAAAFLTACDHPPSDRRDPFTASGELIALSGGEGGAANACLTCHGLEGWGDGGLVPRLSALPSGVQQKQLKDYDTGERPNAVMAAVAHRLSDADRKAVSDYYAARPAPPPRAPADPRLAAEGAALFHAARGAGGLRSCAACHGAGGRGGPGGPPVAAQPAAYTAVQLRSWRTGERRNDPRAVMRTVTLTLSDPQIRALAAYLESAPAAAPPSPPALIPAKAGTQAR